MPSTTVIPVRSALDVHAARRATRGFLGQAGFSERATDEIVLVAVELATNLVRHATAGGELTLRCVATAERRGVEIESRDRGPGIEDVAVALQEGTSTVGGLGGGLPTLRHLMDEFSVESAPGGTVIRATRWHRTAGEQ